jgi:hypothetical protein
VSMADTRNTLSDAHAEPACRSSSRSVVRKLSTQLQPRAKSNQATCGTPCGKLPEICTVVTAKLKDPQRHLHAVAPNNRPAGQP